MSLFITTAIVCSLEFDNLFKTYYQVSLGIIIAAFLFDSDYIVGLFEVWVASYLYYLLLDVNSMYRTQHTSKVCNQLRIILLTNVMTEIMDWLTYNALSGMSFLRTAVSKTSFKRVSSKKSTWSRLTLEYFYQFKHLYLIYSWTILHKCILRVDKSLVVVYNENATRQLRNGLSFSDFQKTIRIALTDNQTSTVNTSVTGTNFQSSTPVSHLRSSYSVNEKASWRSETAEPTSGRPMYSDF